MILVDTSVWIEFFKGKEPYFTKIDSLLRSNRILTSEVIFSELIQGARNDKERKFLNEYWVNLPKFSTDGILIRAALESSLNKWISKGIGLIDACIIQLCRETSSQIWTLDKKLLGVLKNDETYSE